ncbi:MAG: dynamin family protein [Roseobacter sp.]|jgi:GTP-binding protein EngB required for normal cell division|nr:dynamin family protein [Roseobacter sp.]
MIPQESADTAKRVQKPRLVLMGEFSAGKSTLTNIILDSQPLPMRVTATRLPPVEIRYGPPAAHAIGFDGVPTPLALDSLETVLLDDTAKIEVFMEAEVLQLCDLLDMPGISDPNMPRETWENVIEERDHVIWCTHATQAWRQSEAAIWNILRAHASAHNILLITQFDKLQNNRDRMRVRKRVESETRGQFEAIFPVSLLQALEAADTPSAWTGSGVSAFTDHIANLLTRNGAFDRHVSTQDASQNPASASLAADAPAQTGARVLPRRVATGTTAAAREGGALRAASPATG